MINNLSQDTYFCYCITFVITAQVAFPAAQVSGKYTITLGNDLLDKYPKNLKIMCFNDGNNFVQLDLRSGETFAARNQTKTYTFSNSTAYKYYRLYITGNNGSPNLQLSERRLLQ